MSCGYCGDKNHNISVCPHDNELVNLLYSTEPVDFNSLSYKVLRKIASNTPYKTCLPKYELVKIFNRIKTKNNNKINYMSKEENCPICYEKMGTKNVCTTSCGHTFCLECILIMRNNRSSGSNKCPLCRENLVQRDLSRASFQHTNNSRTTHSNISVELNDNGDRIVYSNNQQLNSPVSHSEIELFNEIFQPVEMNSQSIEMNSGQPEPRILFPDFDEDLDEFDDFALFQNNINTNVLENLNNLETNAIHVLQELNNLTINNLDDTININRRNDINEYEIRRQYINEQQQRPQTPETLQTTQTQHEEEH